MSKNLPVEDFVEITNLYNRYNHCSDEADADGYADCFAKDGEHNIVNFEIRVKGRENLRQFKRDNPFNPGGSVYRRHWNGSLFLERVSDTEAKGRCYLLAFNGKTGELPQISDVGVYTDDIVKEDGAWRFKKRWLVFDASSSKPRV